MSGDGKTLGQTGIRNATLAIFLFYPVYAPLYIGI